MANLSRRMFFAAPLVAPVVVPAVVAAASAGPASIQPRTITYGNIFDPRMSLKSTTLEFDLSGLEPIRQFEWSFRDGFVSPEFPCERDLAATLGIEYDGPPEWTDEETAATLGIDLDGLARERLIAAGAPETPKSALEAFRASRPLLAEGGA